MPPRIRSPTPSDQEDQLASDLSDHESAPAPQDPGRDQLGADGDADFDDFDDEDDDEAAAEEDEEDYTPHGVKKQKSAGGKAAKGGKVKGVAQGGAVGQRRSSARGSNAGTGAASSPAGSVSSRTSTRRAAATAASNTPTAGGSGDSASTSNPNSNPLAGLKIKFKLGAGAAPGAEGSAAGPTGATAASSPASSVAGGRKAKGGKGGKAAAGGAAKGKGAAAKGKGKGKKKAETDDSDLSLELTDEDELDLPDEYEEQHAGTSARARALAATAGSSRRGSASVMSGTQSPSAFSSDLDDQDELASDDADEAGGPEGEFDDGYDSAASGESGSTMTTATGDLYGGRKTARQRAKELGGDEALELMSLPNHVSKMPPPARTDAELAQLKAEKSRKRKSQADKKLEDEKTETINRLLNKQVGRTSSSSSTSPAPKGSRASGGDGAAAVAGGKRSRSKLNKSITADGDELEQDEVAAGDFGRFAKAQRVEVKPYVARWISSIRGVGAAAEGAPAASGSAPNDANGEAATTEAGATPTESAPTYSCTYSLPENRIPELAALVESLKSTADAEPKQRGPPSSRRFSAEEKEANRRKNEDGWRKVMLGAA